MSTDAILTTAEKTAPLLRENAAEGDRAGRLPRSSLEALREGGFFRLFTPKTLGGLEADPVTVARATESIARSDAAAAWAIMVASSSAWNFSHLPEDGVKEVLADPNEITASPFTSPVPAVPVEGGFRVSGRAPFASYVQDAAWVQATTLVGPPPSPGHPPQLVAAVMRRDEVEVVPTWNALGMRATDSNDVAFRDVFVPKHRTFPIAPGQPPGRHFRGPLYRIPAMASSVGATISPVALGIAAEAIDEVATLAQGKTPFGGTTLLRDRASTQVKLGRAEALVRSARAYLHQELQGCWDRAQRGETSSLEEKSHMLLAAANAVQSSVEAVDLLYAAAGGSAVYERGRLARLFRDAQVVRQHGLVNESRLQTVGQVRLGLPPEMVFVAF